MRPFASSAAPPKFSHRQPLDVQPAGIELETRRHLARLPARDLGASDLDRQCDVARALECRARQRRIAEGQHRIEIEFRGGERRIEPRGLVAIGPHVDQTAFHGFALELGLEALDPDPIAGAASARRAPTTA